MGHGFKKIAISISIVASKEQRNLASKPLFLNGNIGTCFIYSSCYHLFTKRVFCQVEERMASDKVWLVLYSSWRKVFINNFATKQ